MEIEFVDGPCDGMRRPEPMMGDLPASLVEVVLPARYDSMIDARPSVPPETHLYRRRDLYLIDGYRMTTVYEWRGRRAIRDTDLYRRRPRRH